MFRNQGLHPHLFNNVLDVQPDDHDNAPGDVFTLDDDLKPQWVPPTGGATRARYYVPFGSGEEIFTP